MMDRRHSDVQSVDTSHLITAALSFTLNLNMKGNKHYFNVHNVNISSRWPIE